MDTKKGWEGARPPKAAQVWGPFQIMAAVSVNQAVSVNNVRPEQEGLMFSLLCPTPTTSTSPTPHLHQAPCDHMNLTSDSSPSCNLPICTHVKKPDYSELWPRSGDTPKEVEEICNTGEDNGDDGETAGWNRFEWSLLSQCVCLCHCEHLTLMIST